MTILPLKHYHPKIDKQLKSTLSFGKGYSTIAWTPFFLNITIRCTCPLGEQMVCRTSWKERKTKKKQELENLIPFIPCFGWRQLKPIKYDKVGGVYHPISFKREAKFIVTCQHRVLISVGHLWGFATLPLDAIPTGKEKQYSN